MFTKTSCRLLLFIVLSLFLVGQASAKVTFCPLSQAGYQLPSICKTGVCVGMVRVRNVTVASLYDLNIVTKTTAPEIDREALSALRDKADNSVHVRFPPKTDGPLTPQQKTRQLNRNAQLKKGITYRMLFDPSSSPGGPEPDILQKHTNTLNGKGVDDPLNTDEVIGLVGKDEFVLQQISYLTQKDIDELRRMSSEEREALEVIPFSNDPDVEFERASLIGKQNGFTLYSYVRAQKFIGGIADIDKLVEQLLAIDGFHNIIVKLPPSGEAPGGLHKVGTIVDSEAGYFEFFDPNQGIAVPDTYKEYVDVLTLALKHYVDNRGEIFSVASYF